MQPTNAEIAELFDNMGSLLEIKGDSVFKIRAYKRAARTIEQLQTKAKFIQQTSLGLSESQTHILTRKW